MGDKVDKVKTIVKAFTNPLPVNEEWFKKRMEICSVCEYNSKNIDSDKLSAAAKIKKSVCPEKQHCTACGCCLPQKPSQKTEQCGLFDIGIKPRWSAIEVKINKDKKLSTENLTPDIGSLSKFGNEIIYDLGESNDPKISFSILMSREGGFDVKSTKAGCSCTVAEPVKMTDDSYKFEVSLSTVKFTEGANIKRSFTVEYYGDSNKKTQTAIVSIKLKKK